MTVSASAWAYHTSNVSTPAKPRIARRYAATAARTMRRRSFSEKLLLRAAISRLVASRLTSHSHGPGNVSSKSLTSNTSLRSGEANNPKLARWASPQACTISPDLGVRARSLAIGNAAPRKNANAEEAIRP
jgi:hypothetical protein